MQICGMFFEIRIKEAFDPSFHASERAVFKEFQSTTSSNKEQEGILWKIVIFFLGEKGLKSAHKKYCRYIKSITDKTYYYFKYATTKCIDHEEMLHT